jgi:uncharacterized membrane protein
MGMMLIDDRKLRQAVADLAILDAAGQIEEAQRAIAAELRGQRLDLDGLSTRDRIGALRLAGLVERVLGIPTGVAHEFAVSYFVGDSRLETTIRVLRTMAAPLPAREPVQGVRDA